MSIAQRAGSRRSLVVRVCIRCRYSSRIPERRSPCVRFHRSQGEAIGRLNKLPVPCSTRRRRVETFNDVPRSLIAGDFARKICARSLFSVSLFGWKGRFFAPACNCQSAARSGRQAPLARRVPRGWRALARRAPRRQGLPERALRYAQRRVERFRAVRCRVMVLSAVDRGRRNLAIGG
jgi:hypothetical protein